MHKQFLQFSELKQIATPSDHNKVDQIDVVYSMCQIIEKLNCILPRKRSAFICLFGNSVLELDLNVFTFNKYIILKHIFISLLSLIVE